MEMQGPGGSQPLQLAFEYFPDDHKITYQSVNSAIFQTQGEYDLKDEGSSTLIDLHQSSKVLMQFNVPDAVAKQFIEGIFIAQLETLKKALNITTAEESEDEDQDAP